MSVWEIVQKKAEFALRNAEVSTDKTVPRSLIAITVFNFELGELCCIYPQLCSTRKILEEVFASCTANLDPKRKACERGNALLRKTFA